ncbi:MAG: class I SAM-dependent methyltransferase [Gammaproteobacteria bacterium]
MDKQMRDEADAAVHAWYDDNAERFADAAAIEIPFVGLSADAQERMNRFKLFAIDHGIHVALQGKNVLEFGAGHGRLALAYPSMASYLGVDYSANLVALGTQRLARAGLSDRARLVHGDVLSFAETMAAFDVVCSLGMLTYFPDPEPALRKMSEYLKPGGILFADFRCTSWLYGALRRLKWAIKKPTGGVSYLCHPTAIEAMLARIGLTEIQVVSREFPLLAGLHARQGWDWPLALRNAIADSRGLRMFATDAWVFATKRA